MFMGGRQMAEFKELVEQYKKRSKDQLIDQVALGLTCAESVTEDVGLLTDNGVLREALSTAGTVLPFAVIAVTEEMKVIFGKKDQKTMLKDSAYRMVKTGAALTVGAAAATVAGPVGAVGAAMGTRAFLDRYKSRGLTAVRLKDRITRLKALQERNRKRLELSLKPEDALYE